MIAREVVASVALVVCAQAEAPEAQRWLLVVREYSEVLIRQEKPYLVSKDYGRYS